MYNILSLKASLTGVVHGTTLNKVVNLNGVIERAARQLLSDVDPQETKRILSFTTPIFQNVYTYALAPDVKGNKIIDIRPQTNRANRVYNQSYDQQFNLDTAQGRVLQFNISWNSGIRMLLLDNPFINIGVNVNEVSSLTDNGTWIAGGDASSLTTDTVDWVNGGGSLKFNLTFGTGSGFITTASQQAVDLTDYLNQSTWFLWTYLPTATAFSSVVLQFGSSSSDYYSISATQTQAQTAFANGWNQLSFTWNNATATGSPDISAITYLKVLWNFTGSPQTGVRLNDIVCQKGEIMEYEYYSKYLFRDNLTGVFQETITDDSNQINLDTDSYNLLFNQTGFLAGQQLQGGDASFDVGFFENEYTKGLTRHKGLYKSEVQKPHLYYYRPNRTGYSLSRRWNR